MTAVNSDSAWLWVKVYSYREEDFIEKLGHILHDEENKMDIVWATIPEGDSNLMIASCKVCGIVFSYHRITGGRENYDIPCPGEYWGNSPESRRKYRRVQGFNRADAGVLVGPDGQET